MTGPQFIIAAGLLFETAIAVWGIWRARRLAAGMIGILSPWQRFVVRHGWLLALWPAGQALVLWQGGFWG